MILSFGGSKHERIEIDVTREPSPGSDWLMAVVTVSAGEFRGSTRTSIMNDELSSFLGDLQSLLKTLKGVAELNIIEGQLVLKLTGDGKGHIELEGEVADGTFMANRLMFNLQLDQTDLAASIRELETVTAQFRPGK